jgi:hypothetical protein
MRTLARVALALLAGGGLPACPAGGAGDGADFPGVWQYQEGSFSFVNCYFSSTTVELTRSGFQIVEEAGALVRINPDGCRFTIVPTTARHAAGVAGETCTTHGTDLLGNPVTSVYTVKTLLLELKPDDASQMIEVFSIDADQTTTLGTVRCEISGDNSLDRAP